MKHSNTMNVRQIDTLHFLHARDDINTARRLGVESVSIDIDGMAWAEHCGMDLCASPELGGWAVVRDMKRDTEAGTSITDAVERAERYAAADMHMRGLDKLLRAILNA